MLSSPCRRVATLALKKASAATRLSPTNGSPSHRLPRGSSPTVLFQVTRAPQPPHALRYSTSTDATDTVASATSPPDAARPEKPDYLNKAESAIWDKLEAAFSPTELMVQDVSGGCGSMYGIEISSEKFRGAAMLKQQRMVNAVLGDEMKSWHGIQLRTRVPSQQ